MVKRIQMGVRTWLLGLAMLATAPLLLFGVYSIYQLQVAERTSETHQLILRSQASALAVAQRLNVSLGFLTALASTNAAKQGDVPAMYEQARQAIRLNRDASAITLVDSQERLLFLTLRPLGSEALPVNDLDSVRQVFQTGKPAISKPFKSPVNDNLVVAIGVPVFFEKKVAYCLRLIVPAKIWGVMLEEQKLTEGWISSIIGDSDILLARSKSPERFVGQRVSASLLAALAQRHGAVFESVNLDGITTLTTVAPIPGWNLRLAIGVPLDLLAGDSTRVMRNLLAFGLVVVFLSVFAAVWLSRFIAKRLNLVVTASAAQHRGIHHDLSSTGVREVDAALQLMTSVTEREHKINRSIKDLTVQNQQVHDALSDARKDALTQLPGRAHFLELVEALHRNVSGLNDSQLVILFVDLDGFKGVNDLHGHATGDAVLKQTADVLRDQTRSVDVMGRLGGDEFVICLRAEAVRLEQIAIDVANRVVENVRAIGYGVGCSIGIAPWTSECPDLECVMKRADAAMYEAKRLGKNRFVFSTEG